MKRIAIISLLLISTPSKTHAQADKIQILIVGTVHEYRDSLRNKQGFPQLISELQQFNPDMICIESIPIWDTTSLRKVRSTSIQSASKLRYEKHLSTIDYDSNIDLLRSLLKKDPYDLLTRSQLANLLYANHDFYNAYYHWFMLQEQLLSSPSAATDEVIQSFALDSIHVRAHENQLKSEFGNIIFPLAYGLSIVELENIDDRADDDEFQKLGKHVAKRLLLNLKLFKALKLYKGLARETITAEEEGKLIEKVNSIEFQNKMMSNIDSLSIKWVKSKKSKKALSLWYTRNHRMAERIEKAIQANNAKRVIVFFGAAHIGFVARELKKNPAFNVITYGSMSN